MDENGKVEFLDVFCLNLYGLLVFLCVGKPSYPEEYEEHDYVRLYELKTTRIKGFSNNGKQLIKLHKETKGEWFYAQNIRNCLIAKGNKNCYSCPTIKVTPIHHPYTGEIVIPIEIDFSDPIRYEISRLGLQDLDSIIVGTHYATYIGGIGDKLDEMVFETNMPIKKQKDLDDIVFYAEA